MEIKNALMHSSVDWTQPRDESVGLNIGQYKLSKLKCKERKELGDKRNRPSKTCGTTENKV